MRRLTRTLLAALVCASIPATAGAARFIIRSGGTAFTPNAITVAVGDTVRFSNQSGIHTATSGTGSGDPDQGMWFDFSFSTIGQFGDWIVPGAVGGTVVPFFCVFHEAFNMKGNITVTCPNGAPVVQGIGAQSVNENVLLTVTPSGSDPNGDPLAWSGSNLPSGASVNPGTGVLTWTPSYTQAGVYPGVTIIATDNKTCNATAQVSFTITVNNVNRSPVVDAIGPQNVDENTLLSVVPTGADPDGEALTWSGSSLPAGSSVNAGTGEFTWTPGTGTAGFYPGVTVIASDPLLATGSASFDITVNAAQTGVDLDHPARFGVSAPTPFANRLAFVVASPTGGRVEASVWAASGQLVARIPAQEVPAGWTTLSWNGAGLDGRPAAGGVYLLRVVAGSSAVTQRVVKIR